MSHRPRSGGVRGPRWAARSTGGYPCQRDSASEGGCPLPVETGTSDPPARLRVGVIGPGRAGTALARALARAGHVITAASAVSATSKQRAHENFPGAELE